MTDQVRPYLVQTVRYLLTFGNLSCRVHDSDLYSHDPRRQHHSHRQTHQIASASGRYNNLH